MEQAALVDRIIEHLGGQGRGNLSRAAGRLGVTRQVLFSWKSRGYVPPERAVEVAKVCEPYFDALTILAEANVKRPRSWGKGRSKAA